MTYEELKNGMKSLFSSLGAKTSDSNYAVGLFDKTSAEPKGIMDMASLASVLGGLRFLGYDVSYITDLDNVKESCTFAISTARASSVSNLPIANLAHRFAVIRVDTDNNCIQFAFSNTAIEKDLYYRIFAGQWMGWRKISYTT